MKIIIENVQSKMGIEDSIREVIHRAAEVSLISENFSFPSEISIMLVDNEEIKEINREHRGIDKATDVLSFPMVEMVEGRIISQAGDYDMDENLLLLGDIVVSMEKAKEQAEEYGHSFRRELAFLITHGMFHLLGYDHENPEDQGKMLEKQENVLSVMGLSREQEQVDSL